MTILSDERRRLVAGTFACVVLAASSASAVTRRAFVTSSSGSGDLESWAETSLDGLAGGDEICRVRAAAVALANAGTYRAWLSTSTTDAYCHLFGMTGKAPGCDGGNPDATQMGPWIRRDAKPFAGSLADLVGAPYALYQPVLLTETNVALGFENVWTGTGADGKALPNSCADWTGTGGTGDYGYASVVGRGWTYWAGEGCAALNRLLCLEPGPGDPIAFPFDPGALAFVSSTSGTGDLSTWAETDADGLAGADEVCRVRAAAAFLPNPQSFVALASAAAENAIDRVTYGGPFVRVDGFTFAGTKASLFQPSLALLTGLDVTEFGDYLGTGAESVWTGSDPDGTVAVNNCFDWSGTAGSANFGNPTTTDFRWIGNSSITCAVSFRFYCLSNIPVLFWDNFERADTSRWSSVAP